MFIGKHLVYLDLQKTGSTQITKVFKSIPSEEGIKYRKHITYHQLPDESKIGWDDKIKLGSIRNPWAWYVSLWAYGCGGKGAFYKDRTQLTWKVFKHRRFRSFFIPRKKWRKVYTDVHSKEQFKAWLKMVLFPKGSAFVEYNASSFFNLSGIYTHRYLRLYIKDFLRLEQQLNSKESITQLDAEQNVLDEVIRQENLKEELFLFLEKQNIEITDSIKKLFLKKTNSSYHLDYKEYYDEESISWIKEKEWLIINKYEYCFPLSKD